MKKIYIARHAKSSWKSPEMKDFDRPLNKRGKHDAPLMGKLLRDKGIKPDWIVSSPANRAQTTAKIIAQEVGFPINEIILEQEIYEAYLEDVLNVIQCLPNEVETVFIFGHNPAFTYLVNHFNHGELIMNVPTCGIGCIETNAESWSDIHPDNSNLVSFDYPKLHFYN
jgi:phosphohistidine phosphatase